MTENHDDYRPDIPFRAIVEQSLAGIYILQDECFAYVNATWAEMFGYTSEEMLGGHLDKFVPADFLAEVLRLYWRRIRGDLHSVRFVTHGLHKDGRVILIEVHGTRTEYRGRAAVVGIGIDVTERLRRDEELVRSRAQLQQLAAHINTIREEQRAKFARDVHDVLGGMLTSIKMDVTRILRRVRSPTLKDITTGLLALTQETINTVRKISEELRPSVLDNLGLAAAIEKELIEFSLRHNVKCRLENSDSPIMLSAKRSTAVYRIFQEALTNISRHANASEVQVLLNSKDEEFRMEIVDNGRGINLDTLRVGSIGILSMSERAREIDGALQLGPHPSGGTLLKLVAPLL